MQQLLNPLAYPVFRFWAQHRNTQALLSLPSSFLMLWSRASLENSSAFPWTWLGTVRRTPYWRLRQYMIHCIVCDDITLQRYDVKLNPEIKKKAFSRTKYDISIIISSVSYSTSITSIFSIREQSLIDRDVGVGHIYMGYHSNWKYIMGHDSGIELFYGVSLTFQNFCSNFFLLGITHFIWNLFPNPDFPKFQIRWHH